MTLTIQDLGALGEFLGSIAVLATLVYLAFQTRQNTMAISAQLDVASISALQSFRLAAATSNELGEAPSEDRTDVTTSQARRADFWSAQFLTWQWQHHQARRGLLPTFNQAALGGAVRNVFNRYRSFDDWWDDAKQHFLPDFVEFVEEQRSKAA